MTRIRDYKKEYREYQGTPEQKKNRAQRNAARDIMEKKGLAHKGDGKDVDHINPLRRNGSNAPSNLRMRSHEQRAWNKKK